MYYGGVFGELGSQNTTSFCCEWSEEIEEGRKSQVEKENPKGEKNSSYGHMERDKSQIQFRIGSCTFCSCKIEIYCSH